MYYVAEMRGTRGAPVDPRALDKAMLEQQPGLKLESGKLPIDVPDVNSAEEIPAEK